MTLTPYADLFQTFSDFLRVTKELGNPITRREFAAMLARRPEKWGPLKYHPEIDDLEPGGPDPSNHREVELILLLDPVSNNPVVNYPAMFRKYWPWLDWRDAYCNGITAALDARLERIRYSQGETH